MARADQDWAVGTTFMPDPEIGAPGLGRGRLRRGLGTLRRNVAWIYRPVKRLRWQQKIALALAFTMAITAAWIYFGPASLAGHPPLQNAFLYDRNGRLLAELSPEENRVLVPLSRVPKVVQDAFVAAEDARFWSHPGVDFFAIGRAMVADIRGGRQGASTITQQYVKNAFVGNRRSFGRKVREAIMALRIDRRYPKKKILEAYLNSIYLGQGAYGVEAASRLYFGKHVWQITLPQAALMAGVTSAPSLYSPRVNLALSLKRRDRVITRMRALRMISVDQEAEALATPIRMAKPRARPVVAPMFVDWARRDIAAEVGEDALYRGGLRVTTSLDLDAQKAAEQAIADLLPSRDDPEVSVVSLDVSSGAVRVMVGGRNKRLGDFNLATQGHRQAGSAFKPFVLAAALLDGKKLTSTYQAPSSVRLRYHGAVWPVSNFDHSGYGRLTLKNGLAYSVNTVFAQLIKDVGPPQVIDVARRLGFKSALSDILPLALGTSPVTPLEMASAYAAFDNKGVWLKPSALEKVVAEDGTVLFNGERDPQVALPVDVADDVREALRAVARYGTASRVRLKHYDVYGKTGTTENHTDAWFVGFAGDTVTAVWMGYPNKNKPMTNIHGIKVTGNSFPARIWERTMEALLSHSSALRNDEYGPSKGASTNAPQPSAQPSPEPLPSEEPTASPTPRAFPIVIPTLP
jgi:penicillin-binding protein 1A